MGQAAVDLPDPLENPNRALITSADDLLAQLAGDEIDRLLAESDIEKDDLPPDASVSSTSKSIQSGAQPDAANPHTHTKPQISPVTSSDIDDVLAELKTTLPTRQASSQAASAVQNNAPSPAVVDAVPPTILPKEDSPNPESAGPQSTVAAAAQPAALSPVAALIELDVSKALLPRADEQTGADERAGLEDVEITAGSMEIPDLQGDGNVPIFLKPLVWLNAPLEMFPDELREAMGKIAIVTMVNAIAVIAYVVIFRRHH